MRMSGSVTNDLIYETLKSMQAGQKQLRDGQRLTNERLSAIEHHMAGFHVTVSNYQEEISDLRERMERVEKRLELRD